MPSIGRGNERAITLALARQAYADRRVRLVDASLDGFSHLVATRNGLFVANRSEIKLICHGLFFGLVAGPDCLLVFECCDLPSSPTRLGRILKFTRTETEITGVSFLAEGLENGCHQMDIVDGRLVLLDTYQQRILAFPLTGGAPQAIRPVPAAQVNDWDGGYRHFNSITQVGAHLLLMFHNGAGATGKGSEIGVFDLHWQQQQMWSLPDGGCHDIGLLDDETLLCCGSMGGQLIASDGRAVPVGTMMTRGLSVGADSIVVGSSRWAPRQDRTLAKGLVTFMTPDFQVVSEMEIGGGPTDICRLDGLDRTLSEHLLASGSTRLHHEGNRWRQPNDPEKVRATWMEP